MFSANPCSSRGGPNKIKFVEGSVTQLARVLYAIHEENGAQPETAIFEAIKTFGDDVDRNKILNAARSSAEALTRKQKIPTEQCEV